MLLVGLLAVPFVGVVVPVPFADDVLLRRVSGNGYSSTSSSSLLSSLVCQSSQFIVVM